MIVAKPGDLAPYYNVTAISSDGTPPDANYDGDGFSYSQQALAAAGITPGGTVTAGGLTYTWPSAAAGTPDAVGTAGQTLAVTVPAGATQIGFLGSAVNGGTTGASGTVTVTYTDGSTSTATLGITDWTEDAGTGSTDFGNTVVAQMPYRDYLDGSSQEVTTYLFAATIGVDSSKTVASVTLPRR